jgi:hypothetical protein
MSTKSNVGFKTEATSGSADTFKTLIVQGRPGVQAVCKNLRATSASASSLVLAFAARAELKTTVKTATADQDTTIVLNGDDATGFINGYQIADGDYLLVNTNAGRADDASGKRHSWRVLTISGATETGASDQVSCTVAGLDGHTGLEGTVSAGATAYILRADQAVNYAVGAATIAVENAVAGDPGEPIAFVMDPAAATAHNYNILVEYV